MTAGGMPGHFAQEKHICPLSRKIHVLQTENTPATSCDFMLYTDTP